MTANRPVEEVQETSMPLKCKRQGRGPMKLRDETIDLIANRPVEEVQETTMPLKRKRHGRGPTELRDETTDTIAIRAVDEVQESTMPLKRKKQGRGPMELTDETTDMIANRPVEEIQESTMPLKHKKQVRGPTKLTDEGTCTRYKVPINIKDWKSVGQDIKDDLWTTIQRRHNKPEKYKKKTLSNCATMWRKFKSNLYTGYVRPNVKDPEKFRHPPVKYTYILQNVWDDFLLMRLTEEWEKLSNRASARRKLHKYDHHIARMGYGRFEKKLVHVFI